MLRFTLITSILFLSSCFATGPVYIQSESFSTSSAVQFNNKRPQYKLQENDVLSIRVKSPEPSVAEQFNISANGGGELTQASLYLNGYVIDNKGEIKLPYVGTIEVVGLTVEEIQEKVQTAIDGYLKDATAMVKMVSFKVTVLGEVNRPGTYYVYDKEASVFECIGLAGDITKQGSRTNVKLIRKNPKGSEIILLDLSDANIMRSNYYYIMPNDVLYVQPFVKE